MNFIKLAEIFSFLWKSPKAFKQTKNEEGREKNEVQRETYKPHITTTFLESKSTLKQYAITIYFYFFGFEWCVINAREKERKLTFYKLEKEMYKQVSTGLSCFDLFLDSSCYNSLVANLTPKLAIVQKKPGYVTYFADISLSTYHNSFPSSNYT